MLIPKLTAHQIRELSVRSHRDPRTVMNAYLGRAKDIAASDVKDAAQALGYPPPPTDPPPQAA